MSAPERQVLETRESRGSAGGGPVASLLVPATLVLAVLGALIPFAMGRPLVAVGGAGLLLVVILAGVLGAERASVVMLVMAFGFAPVTSLAIGPPPFVLASAFLVIAFLLVLPRLIHEPVRIPVLFTVGALFFTIMGLASIPLAIDSLISFAYLAIAVLGLVVIPVMMVWMKPTDRQIYWMLIAFCVGVVVSTLVGIPRNEFRNRGLTYHPVALAYTATLALSFIPFLLSSKERTRWLAVPLAGVALVAVWTSGSRTGLLVLAALVLLVPVLARSILLGAAVTAGAVVAVPRLIVYAQQADTSSALARLVGRGSADGSNDARLFGLREALHQIQANPVLGNGYSTEHTYIVHNLYLQVFAAEGIVGLIGLLLMLTALVLGLRSTHQRVRFLAYPALAAIVSGPFQPNMGDHYLGMSLGLSLLAATRYLQERRDSKADDVDDGVPALRAESATKIR